MPKTPSPTPYFFCKIIHPSLFDDGTGRCQHEWHEKAGAGDAIEIGPLLIQMILDDRTKKKPLQDSQVRERINSTIHYSPYSWHKPDITLSLEKIDALLADLNQDKSLLIYLPFLLWEIRSLLRAGYSIGVNFREVFLLQDHEARPAHYRPGIDIIVKCPRLYRDLTHTLSYQLARALINKPALVEYTLPATTDIQSYSNAGAMLTNNNPAIDFNMPLNQLRYFGSLHEALDYSDSIDIRKENKQLVLAFGAAVDMIVLEPLLASNVFAINAVEIIIILHGPQYQEEHARQRVYDELLVILKKFCIKRIIQVFLLTDTNIEASLASLVPDTDIQSDTFIACTDDKAYYLHSAAVLSQIYRNIQQSVTKGLTIQRNNIALLRLHTLAQSLQVSPKRKIGPYIQREAADRDFRQSKRLTPHQLKMQATLAINHQLAHDTTQTQQQIQQQDQAQEVSQNQDLSQQQQLTQQTDRMQQQTMESSGFWLSTCDVSEFCNLLQVKANKELHRFQTSESFFLARNGHFTQQWQYFYHRIANDEDYRASIAARIYGLACLNDNGEHRFIKLPGLSFDTIEQSLATRLIDRIEAHLDGLEPCHCSVSTGMWGLFGSSRCLTSYTGQSYYPDSTGAILSYSLLGHFGNGIRTYPNHLTHGALLAADDLNCLSSAEKTRLIANAELLLNLFTDGLSRPSEEVIRLENMLVDLVGFYFPGNDSYQRIIQKFISLFEEHNEDNIKILVHVILCGYRSTLDYFFQLLLELESRSLLEQFYKVYFKYALEITSVSGLVISYRNTPFDRVFLRSIDDTPLVSSADEWPIINKFCHHFLLFYKKNNLAHPDNTTLSLKQIWYKLHAKFLCYTDHQEDKAQQLLEILVNHLITTDGLSLAPVKASNTLISGLHLLIDHAIANHTLEEQLTEINGLSLLWTDVPYAIRQHRFQVVCAEMELHAAAVNSDTGRYSVSLNDLIRLSENHAPGKQLKTALFRYLGTTTLRESLDFYRTLINRFFKDTPPEPDQLYLNELIVLHYILLTTSIHYGKSLDKIQFKSHFYDCIEKNPRFKSIDVDCLQSTIDLFFNHLEAQISDRKSSSQADAINLWCIWGKSTALASIDNEQSIPAILMRKFHDQQLIPFVLENRTAITAYTSSLHPEDRQELACLLIETLVALTFNDSTHGEFTHHTPCLLRSLYPALDIDYFINDSLKIETFISSYALLMKGLETDCFYDCLKPIFASRQGIDDALRVMQLITHPIPGRKASDQLTIRLHFLFLLTSREYLQSALEKAKPLLTQVIAWDAAPQEKLKLMQPLFILTEKLLALGNEEATQALTVILKHLKTPEGKDFLALLNHQLTASQINSLTQIVAHVNDLSHALPLIKALLEKNPEDELTEITTLLQNMSQENAISILTIYGFIGYETSLTGLEQLQALACLSFEERTQLIDLIALHAITRPEFFALLSSPSILDSIAQFLQEKYAGHLSRFTYDPLDVEQKTQAITFKYTDDVVLGEQIQKRLLIDYDLLMSYMQNNPVLTEQSADGSTRSLTISALNEKQFQAVFLHALPYINGRNPAKKHQYQLLVLGLCCEALYRTTGKFPRNIQILSVLNSLNHHGNLTHEIKTGEGKSIIAAFHAVLLCAEQRTVDVVTENDQLARDGLKKFSRFYRYLGLPYGTDIVQAHSPHATYIENGINYSTASNLALFRARMALDKKPMPQRLSLICDEIDATLTTTVQYRLSSTLNPLFYDTESWSFIYQILLEFINEKTIFQENNCSKAEDIENFRNYFLLKNPGQDLTRLLDKVTNECLEKLIESAMITAHLQEGIDYLVVEKEQNSYAAPILDHTKRPDKAVSFSNHVQGLLHTKLNQQNPDARFPFKIESDSEAIIVISADNFFRDYRKHAGRIIGFTGTAGSNVELQEFYQQHGLMALSYPSYRENRCIDRGLTTAIGKTAHQDAIFACINQNKTQTPDQPILVITSSPKAAQDLNDYLINRAPDWKIQQYDGHEQPGMPEEGVIARAGTNAYITIATQSLARGADFEPNHPQGLLVINTCVDTASKLRQIKGRAARNGKPGQFCSVIDIETLDQQSFTTPAEKNAAFIQHQQAISDLKQKQRQNKRLLEAVRHHIVEKFLALRKQADSILSRQHGQGSSLIPAQEFIQALADFNQRAEEHYNTLLKEHTTIDPDTAKLFINARIEDYLRYLNTWLNETQCSNFTAIEPLIPIENLSSLTSLHAVPLEQILPLSELSSKGWAQLGHKNMQALFTRIEQGLETFEPYFNHESSFQSALAESLLDQKIYAIEDILNMVKRLESYVSDFLNVAVPMAESVPIINRFISKDSIQPLITGYFTTTREQIEQKKWDDLALPTFDLSGKTVWLSRISNAMGILKLVQGPIPYIVNLVVSQILLPTIKALLKQFLRTSESNLIQILIGIDELSSHLTDAVTALVSISDPNERTLRHVVDKIKPLIQNRAFISLITKVLTYGERTDLIKYVESIPSLLQMLEPHLDKPLNETLNAATLLQLLPAFFEIEPVKKALEGTEFKFFLEKTLILKPALLAGLRDLTLAQLVALLRVIAHPNFLDFLKKMPGETTLAGLIDLLGQDDLQSLSPEIAAALTELRHYQTNHQRIAAESERAFRDLKRKFHLGADDIPNPVLPPLDPSRIEAPKLETRQIYCPTQPAQTTSWLKCAIIILCITLVITYTVLFFSFTTLLTSLILSAFAARELLKSQPQASAETQAQNRRWDQAIEPVTVLIADENTTTLEQPDSLPANNDTPQPKTTSLAGNVHTLFHRKSHPPLTLAAIIEPDDNADPLIRQHTALHT